MTNEPQDNRQTFDNDNRSTIDNNDNRSTIVNFDNRSTKGSTVEYSDHGSTFDNDNRSTFDNDNRSTIDDNDNRLTTDNNDNRLTTDNTDKGSTFDNNGNRSTTDDNDKIERAPTTDNNDKFDRVPTVETPGHPALNAENVICSKRFENFDVNLEKTKLDEGTVNLVYLAEDMEVEMAAAPHLQNVENGSSGKQEQVPLDKRDHLNRLNRNQIPGIF